MPKYDVFLFHNSADKPAVEALPRRLADEAGLNPFLDKWYLIPGDPWQEALEEDRNDLKKNKMIRLFSCVSQYTIKNLIITIPGVLLAWPKIGT